LQFADTLTDYRVFIRLPALGNTDPANDWSLAVDQGYEIQIDDTGKNPDLNPSQTSLKFSA
jgi:hypothetical protein